MTIPSITNEPGFMQTLVPLALMDQALAEIARVLRADGWPHRCGHERTPEVALPASPGG